MPQRALTLPIPTKRTKGLLCVSSLINTTSPGLLNTENPATRRLIISIGVSPNHLGTTSWQTSPLPSLINGELNASKMAALQKLLTAISLHLKLPYPKLYYGD